MFDIQPSVDRWIAQGKEVALATVVQTWGSGPRREGAKMAVAPGMEMIGSVSGGCVEGAVVEEALAALQDRRPRLLRFGVTDENAWEVGLTCGGELTVFVEALDRSWWQSLSDAAARHQSAATALVLEGDLAGRRVLLLGDEPQPTASSLTDRRGEALAEAARKAIRQRRCLRESSDGLEIFVDLQLPRPRLIIVGGAHVAISLQSLARELGFRVILIDPRQAFATKERFPHVEEIIHEYPHEALPRLGLDSETYVAVLTHDPKIDDGTLLHALPSPAPYVGVLSSLKSHRKRVERLTAQGLDPALLERLHVPIGLKIGGREPEEIALAILAEIVSVRGKRGDNRG
ncbi:MAG: XdhC/CoxI family protein [Acidobacteriota bacterium]